MADFPCDSSGVCMVCHVQPPKEENLECKTCFILWHVACLSTPPATLADTAEWVCPNCSDQVFMQPTTKDGSAELNAAILTVEGDASPTDQDKSRKHQERVAESTEEDENNKNKNKENEVSSVSDILAQTLNCSICIQLPERPVTTPRGHTFCVKCFEKWIRHGKQTCPKCREIIPAKMASQPCVNSALVYAIGMVKTTKNISGEGSSGGLHFIHNQDKPDQAYTTDKAKRNGQANAACGRIFVTVPSDHFGPIPPQNDPKQNQGLLVGQCWKDRKECRQWGAHFPCISGIAGQANRGAQSVVLSGGYVDDEDHGEWFLYTGSGGKDLSGNKRTNKTHSFDQEFKKYNQALKVSCLNGYPVRVVRSHKAKRPTYSPRSGLRYDGIYRIEKCWQIEGLQGFKVCRFLFVRCDNQPAFWTRDVCGDRPRPLPVIRELDKATIVIERKQSPSWDFDVEDSCWKWIKPPPLTQKYVGGVEPKKIATSPMETKKFQTKFIKEQLQRGFSCQICKQVMISPVTTPCAHHFCKSCLEGAFVGQPFVRERSLGGRSLRTQKVMKKCPSCIVDISDYLHNLKVDICLRDTIETLKAKVDEIGESMESSEDEDSEDDDRLQEDYDEDPNVTCTNPLVDGCAPTTSRKSKKRSSASQQTIGIAAGVVDDGPTLDLQEGDGSAQDGSTANGLASFLPTQHGHAPTTGLASQEPVQIKKKKIIDEESSPTCSI